MARIIDYEAQNIVGNNVRKYRLERNLSQQELSERLETYAIYICRGSIPIYVLDSGRKSTDYELKALAEVLKVSVEDMFEQQ